MVGVELLGASKVGLPPGSLAIVQLLVHIQTQPRHVLPAQLRIALRDIKNLLLSCELLPEVLSDLESLLLDLDFLADRVGSFPHRHILPYILLHSPPIFARKRTPILVGAPIRLLLFK